MKKLHIEDLRTGEKEYILSFDGYIKIEDVGAIISGRKFKLSVSKHFEINENVDKMSIKCQ